MFNDLKDAYQEMMKSCSHIVDESTTSHNGIHIAFPEDLFNKFEQEYKLCFVEEEDDVAFQGWQDKLEGEDEQ